MRCHHCNNVMQQTDLLDDRGVRQVWYGCPVCSARHTIVQPSEVRLYRIGQAQRCSSGWRHHSSR
ncbi:MAG: hypothetical protein KDJ24_10505 [Gammaproteobacteria bacterium]|nr:hypothetical protein [Gammaproteobacteria bacterium]